MLGGNTRNSVDPVQLLPTAEKGVPRIRRATPADSDGIRRVHSLAFDESEAASVARLACQLLTTQSDPETISLVAEAEEAIVAHAAFSPVRFAGAFDHSGYLLAPLAVRPDRQRLGIGERLTRAGLSHLSAAGVDVVLVYGDPAYYRRFGFGVEDAALFVAPYPMEQPTGWQALLLNQQAKPRHPVGFSCVPPLCDAGLW